MTTWRTRIVPVPVRTGLTVLGAATLLVGGVDLASYAAGGGTALVAGHHVRETRPTQLQIKGKGPALRLKARKGPALAVNSTAQVPKLNASLVGGLAAPELEPATTVYTLPDPALPKGFTYRQLTVPAGTYELTMHGLYVPDAVDAGSYYVSCNVVDASALSHLTVATADQVYLAAVISSGAASGFSSDAAVVTFSARATLAYGCDAQDATKPIVAAQPLTLAVRPLRVAVGTSTPAPAAARVAGRLTPR